MAVLLDLPNEILGDAISELQPVHVGELTRITPKTDLLALSLTSKRLHSLTQRVLYQDIQLQSHDRRKLRVLLRNILTEPELAAHIVRISFLRRGMSHIPPQDFPGNEDDAKLARKFVSTVRRANIPRSKQWTAALCQGRQDAQMALLVLCATNLQVLQLGLHQNQTDFTIPAVEHVISQSFECGPAPEQTFHKLQHVSVDASLGIQNIGVSYLLLPSLRGLRFEGSARSHLSGLAIDHVRQRPANLTLTSLTLPCCSNSWDGLLSIIGSCKVLEHFHITSVHEHALPVAAINEALQLANSPLARLSLYNATPIHGIPVGSLQHLSVLRELLIDVGVLLGKPPRSNGFLPRILPASVVQLSLSLNASQKSITDNLPTVYGHLQSLETSCAAGLFPQLREIELNAYHLGYGDRHVAPTLGLWEAIFRDAHSFPQNGTDFFLRLR